MYSLQELLHLHLLDHASPPISYKYSLSLLIIANLELPADIIYISRVQMVFMPVI
jgi:hypothetical protein